MAGCCEHDLRFEGISGRYKAILWIVIAINALMFLVEIGASVVADSMALRADALDFLGDTLTYGITLLAIGHSLRWRASAAMFKGVTLLLMGLWVLGSTLHQVLVLGIPNEMMMGSVAMLAFAANMTSVLLLLRYRDGNANVRSVWLCSRNDAIGNVAVMFAAVAVYYTQTKWPDLIVAFLMSGLFFYSSFQIIIQARGEFRECAAGQVESAVCAEVEANARQ
jgi:cation diffusion facilitator family transporter